jgi:hypothetical protein
MKLHGGIGNLAAAFGGMAAAPAHEKSNLEINESLRSRGVFTPRGGRTISPRQAAGNVKKIARCNR